MNPFQWVFAKAANPELPDIFPLPINQGDFITVDVQNIYTRILTDVIERTEGIQEENKKLLWDNCSKGESQDGVITLLSKAMAGKTDLFLVIDNGVIRKATPAEQEQIRTDYKSKAESKVGIFITFGNYNRTDMLKFYSALEYCTVGGLYKSMNLSKALQLKFNEMRSSTGLSDSADIKTQAVAIAAALNAGKAVMADAKDIFELAKPDMTATNSAMTFIDSKRSFYLGLPASWITGLATSGLSDSGKADSKAVERGLKPYFFSVIKPVVDSLFKIKSTFQTEDFDMLGTATETLKTFEVTGEELISKDNKTMIINQLFGLPENAKGDAPPKVETPPAVPPKNPVVPPNPPAQ